MGLQSHQLFPVQIMVSLISDVPVAHVIKLKKFDELPKQLKSKNILMGTTNYGRGEGFISDDTFYNWDDMHTLRLFRYFKNDWQGIVTVNYIGRGGANEIYTTHFALDC